MKYQNCPVSESFALFLDVVVDHVSKVWLDPKGPSFTGGEMVTCKADGYPLPSFHWIRLFDNVTVADGATLTEYSTYYSYICSASNDIGGHVYRMMSAEITFTVITGICP